MAVNLSALAGAGQQFFDNNGVPLAGGKLYSYAAGTTTPQTAYTSASGSTPLSNPIILDSGGRVATGEIWITAGSNYKFVLKTSTDTTLATWDNITGINGTGITSNASNVTYDPAGTGAVSTTVQTKLRQTVSVLDFGADTAAADNTTAIQAALNYVTSVNGTLIVPGIFKCASPLTLYVAAITIKGYSALLCGLQYTGTGSGTFITSTSCESVHFETIGITYTSSSFTGTLVKHVNGARHSFFKCSLNGVGVSSATYLLDLSSSITTECIRTRFSGGQTLVNGGTASTTIGFTNCDFDTYAITSIYRPRQGWSIINCAFENAIDGTGSAILTEATDNVLGLVVSGCWMGDATSATAFRWIYLGRPKGVLISGNYINGTGYLNSTAINIAGASSGVVVKGNYFGSFATGVALNSLCTSYDIGQNSVTAGCTEVTGVLQQSVGNYVIGTRAIRTGSSGIYLESPTYGTSIAIDSSAGDNFVITVTNGTAFTINNPINTNGSQIISIKIVNSSGGAMGTITWGSNYRLATWTNPANATSRTIDFVYNNSVWVEKSRTPADVPN